MISVLVVDDSVVIRRLVTDVLAADRDIRVVGTAPNGKIALDKIEQLQPDLVTLDVEMPVLGGVDTVRLLRRTHPYLPVIMFSTQTGIGADATLAALAAGATDYVTKPSEAASLAEAVAGVREQLLPRIHALCDRPQQTAPVRCAVTRSQPATAPVRAIVVAASTGGPEALRVFIDGLPGDLAVPVFVVQHMPPVFTTMLARRIDEHSSMQVVEATADLTPCKGTVYLAPGDRHLEVTTSAGRVRTRLHDGPKESHCRPAADVLFRSAASVYGAGVLGVVLTGMGQDGRRGSEALVAAGSRVVVQDQASSVVWGMPGAVAAAGLADAVLPLRELAAYVMSRIASRPAALTAGGSL